MSDEPEDEALNRAAEKVAGWLTHLIDPDQLVEVRALEVLDGKKSRGKNGSTWAGTFHGTELVEMAKAALSLSGKCFGVYYTLNPLKPEFHVVKAPRLGRVGKGQTADDKDVLARRWLLIDFDPIKAAGFEKESATNDEKDRTRHYAVKVQDWLNDQGWPRPVFSDSGNGHHLLYRFEDTPPVLPLPQDDPVRMALRMLAESNLVPPGMIDTTNFNPARIVKFPGTMACKGTPTDERPHRRARVLETP